MASAGTGGGAPPTTNKVGSFDWIFEFSRIQGFFASEYTGIVDPPRSRVLVAGCGTSKLSAQLVADVGFGEVVSVDNDAGCIAHMAGVYRAEPRLRWCVHDLVEPHTTVATFPERDGSFDLVVDKGTLDAVLVEGAVHSMLAEVHRLLRVGGVYLVFSINSDRLLHPLLSMEALGFDVTCHDIVELKPGHARPPTAATVAGTHAEGLVVSTVAVCRKRHAAVDLRRLADEEAHVLDVYFKEERPLLTADEEARVRDYYDAMGAGAGMDMDMGGGGGPSLDLPTAYRGMFDVAMGGCDELGYSYELFLEDVERFTLQRPGRMSADEAVEFLRTMQ